MHSFTTVVLLFIPQVLAHSWIEQLQLISSNGTYSGDAGYARGYMARTDPGFNGYSDKWQLPSPDIELGRTRINSTDLLCHPSQRTANYSSKYPKLEVSPDTYVALRYLENGHVTQPWIPAGKPAGSGTVFVYGTYSPSATEKIVDVLSWTTDGKGGNGQGFLMTAQNFDDGRCHQPNSAPISIERQMADTDGVPGQESWCETDLHIPADSKAGSTLTIYWIWSWQTSLMTEGAVCGKDEYYTTCADVDIVGNTITAQSLFDAAGVHRLSQQDPQHSAVSDYKSRTAIMTTPNLITTEGCSITSVTSSAPPASLTQMTTLPARFWETFSRSDSAQATSPDPSSPTISTPSSSPVVASSTASSASLLPMSTQSTSQIYMTTTVTEVSVQTVTAMPLTSTMVAPSKPVQSGSSGSTVLDALDALQQRRASIFKA